jgi:hypothetical protein
MKKLLFISVFILFYQKGYSQHNYGENLVPNASLDSFSICPDNYWQIDRAVPWTQPLWQSASSVLNQCMFDGYPTQMDTTGCRKLHWHSQGMAYNIIWAEDNWRTYIEVPLKSKLKASECYYAELYTIPLNVCYKTIDAIGIFFSDSLVKIKNDSIVGSDTLNLIKPIYIAPQISNPVGNIIKDTANWTKISGTFVAQGTESAMIVGNFIPSNQINWEILNNWPNYSSWYFFDDFVVCKCSDTIPSDTIKPKEPVLEVYPNPAKDELYILFNGYDKLNTIDLSIYNILGEMVMNEQIESSSYPTGINIKQISAGCYVLVIKSASKTFYKERLVIIK